MIVGTVERQEQPQFFEQLGRCGRPVYNKLERLGRNAFGLLVTKGCEPGTLIGLLILITQKGSVQYLSPTEVNSVTEDKESGEDSLGPNLTSSERCSSCLITEQFLLTFRIIHFSFSQKE